jgi:hypothetical protein
MEFKQCVELKQCSIVATMLQSSRNVLAKTTNRYGVLVGIVVSQILCCYLNDEVVVWIFRVASRAIGVATT